MTMDPAVNVPYGAMDDVSVGVNDGRILWIAKNSDIPAFDDDVEVINGDGRWLGPGLVDCHTHIVYGGDRAREWEMRLGGVSYEQIAREGGGILSSVRSTRAASEESLVQSALKRLDRLVSEGVTTIEIKSGYGLDLETELKMLRAARTVGNESGIHVETTLLAAHAIPPEFSGKADDYVELICREIIPAATDLCSCVDAFCESIAFNVEQTRRVFEAALSHGLRIKVHAEQLTHTGIAAIAAEMGAVSADHLEYLSEPDCRVLAENGTVATILPGAFYCLCETKKPPIEALQDSGAAIAIATDCNPGSSPVTSLLLMGNMACTMFRMTPELAFAGITRSAAQALALQDECGMIRTGMRADFAVWDVNEPAAILYGVGHNPCVGVYRGGNLIK